MLVQLLSVRIAHRIRFYPTLLALLSVSCGRAICRAETAPPVARDTVRIVETFQDGFRHPGIGLTREILENARAQVIAGREPWRSGFLRLASHPDSARTISCRNESKTRPGWPEVDAFDNKGIEGRLRTDGSKAKRQALLYVFTGEEVYRANALRILRVWSRMDRASYRNYREAHIHASYPVQDMILAAELLRYTSASDPLLQWTEADTQAFTDNLANPAVSTFLDGNQWFMNQSGYPLAASMAGDIFTNNRAAYEKRVEWFTVNRDAPNQGWAYSIERLARLVETDALTGEKVAAPFVQLMEMGRDQAHAGGDVEIFMNVARQLNAQGSRVDPLTGRLSDGADAVGPYAFRDHRILAAADYFCRFMLGYETPWTPVAYDIGPDGATRGVYPRIADNYRGRLRGFDFWDAYYYACAQGVDLSVRAPYYHEAFIKRIVKSDTDWLYIPARVSGEPARVAPTEQEPAAVEIEQRSALFDARARTVTEGGDSFVRVEAAGAPVRIAFLSMDTDSQIVALRYRSTGVAEVRMSGFARPWLLPPTGGVWRVITYVMGPLERFRDIVYFDVSSASSARVDFDRFFRKGAEKIPGPAFADGGGDLEFVAWVGAPVALAFAPTGSGEGKPVVGMVGSPQGATVNPQTGAFFWRPARACEVEFFATLSTEESISARRVRIIVVPDFGAAVRRIVALRREDVPYVAATLARCRTLLGRFSSMSDAEKSGDFAWLMELKRAYDGLLPLSPLLPDGSLDFPGLVASSDIGKSIGLLTDGNDDTFPVHTLGTDFNYIFDFGAGYRVSIDAFAIEGRLNFEDRACCVSLHGSEDGKVWTRLGDGTAQAPATLTRASVKPGLEGNRYRYLKIEKARSAGGLFEPAEFRLYGRRHESP